jgi:NAD(P)-dependent dehydrogenase (short-subunit alcohol dehydrogenase family)
VKRALVIGGTGHVGGALLPVLRAAGVLTAFTWHHNELRASELAQATGASPHRLDLRNDEAVLAFARHLIASDQVPDVIIHLAAHPDWRSIDDLDLAGWDDVFDVTVRGPFALIQALATPLRERGCDLVFVTGMAPLRSVAAPPQAAAAQGALAGLVRSLTRSLAPRVRANVLALGTLDGGTATRIDASFTASQERFSALRRVGRASEIAEAIRWLALENSYLSGAVIPAAGGL